MWVQLPPGSPKERQTRELVSEEIYHYGAVVQRIGHIPSKDTMLVRFQLASPEVVKKEKELALASSFSVSNTSVATPAGR